MMSRSILLTGLCLMGMHVLHPASVSYAQSTRPSEVLPGRPDKPAEASPHQTDSLGVIFESQAAGIAFRAPSGWKEVRRAVGDEIVQYRDEARKRVLQVNRLRFSQPVTLLNIENPVAGETEGLIHSTTERIKRDFPGAQVFRADAINVQDVEVGMIAARVQLGTEDNLVQQALVKSDDRLYYQITLTVPTPRGVKVEDDPPTVAAVELFADIVDSVRLLDQEAVRHDQDERLYRTRSLFVNLTEERLRSSLAAGQWLRLIQDNKDVGYTYIVEEIARDLPRRGVNPLRQGGEEGILVGVRSRTQKDGYTVDAESWMFSTFDRNRESWSNFAITSDPKGAKTLVTETGSSVKRNKPTADPEAAIIPAGPNAERDPNRGIRLVEEYRIDVTTQRKDTPSAPFTKLLPPWYLPNAIGHLMPRLVATMEPKSYLFATYVSEHREIMLRYVDVERERDVLLDGKTVRAIPIRDRIGLEGSVTTHYISPKGVYLGSENKDAGILILASDAATIERIWKDANLTRPSNVDERPQR